MKLKIFTNREASLNASFVFCDFRTAFVFMTEVAFVAEKMSHHPDWSNSYNKVNISITTHDAGKKLTEKDYLLAEQIEIIVEKYLL